MNAIWVIPAALCLAAVVASPQEKTVAFVIDPSRPFVYVAFDHVGHREPVVKGENPQGLWLRLVNNSRIPIQVRTFDLGTSDHEVGINYDVVAVSGIVDEPPPAARPRGYSSAVGSPAVIEPGQSLLFSIPGDHVSKWWYIQARFELVLPSPRAGTQPFSIVSFYREGIPPKYREVQ